MNNIHSSVAVSKNNRLITEIFKNGKVLITYLTAGDPSLDKTEDYI